MRKSKGLHIRRKIHKEYIRILRLCWIKNHVLLGELPPPQEMYIIKKRMMLHGMCGSHANKEDSWNHMYIWLFIGKRKWTKKDCRGFKPPTRLRKGVCAFYAQNMEIGIQTMSKQFEFHEQKKGRRHNIIVTLLWCINGLEIYIIEYFTGNDRFQEY